MILHLMHNDKFILPFIKFINLNFDKKEHKFIIINDSDDSELIHIDNVEFRNSNQELRSIVLPYMKKYKKIILHGLFRKRIVELLYTNPYLLQKCYWIMWGGDFYFPEKQNAKQSYIIQNVAYLVTGTKGEVTYVRKYYQAKGQHIKAFVYTSNLYKNIGDSYKNNGNTIKILVGNSSTLTNQHKEIFAKLVQYKNQNIQIYVPLSYGDYKYGMEVMKDGYELFGNKFKPLIHLLKEDEYYNFLKTIDIAIMYHSRQQGMGNIITLLGMGKKVYMNPAITTFNMLKDLNIEIFDFHNFNLNLLESNISIKNQEIIKKNFSEKQFIKQLNNIFYL